MIRANARETLGLILMLVGLGLLGATVKAAGGFHPPPPGRYGLFDPSIVYEAPRAPSRVRLSCPVKGVILRPRELAHIDPYDGEHDGMPDEWFFPVGNATCHAT